MNKQYKWFLIVSICIGLFIWISSFVYSLVNVEASIESQRTLFSDSEIFPCFVEWPKSKNQYFDLSLAVYEDLSIFYYGVPVTSVKVLKITDEGWNYQRYFWGIPLDTKVYDC